MWKMIDLCAGIGGIRRGYELAGDFKCVLSAEIDKYACMTYEHLYGDNPKNDITDETFKEQVHNTEYTKFVFIDAFRSVDGLPSIDFMLKSVF